MHTGPPRHGSVTPPREPRARGPPPWGDESDVAARRPPCPRRPARPGSPRHSGARWAACLRGAPCVARRRAAGQGGDLRSPRSFVPSLLFPRNEPFWCRFRFRPATFVLLPDGSLLSQRDRSHPGRPVRCRIKGGLRTGGCRWRGEATALAFTFRRVSLARECRVSAGRPRRKRSSSYGRGWWFGSVLWKDARPAVWLPRRVRTGARRARRVRAAAALFCCSERRKVATRCVRRCLVAGVRSAARGAFVQTPGGGGPLLIEPRAYCDGRWSTPCRYSAREGLQHPGRGVCAWSTGSLPILLPMHDDGPA